MIQGLAASAESAFNPYIDRVGLTLLNTGKRLKRSAEAMRQAVKQYSGYASLKDNPLGYTFERASQATFDAIVYGLNQPRANQHGILLEEPTQNLAPATLASLWNDSAYQYITSDAEGTVAYSLIEDTDPALQLEKTDAGAGAFGWRTPVSGLSGSTYTVSLDVWSLSSTGRFTLFASFNKSGGTMQATTRINLSELTPQTWNRITVSYPASASNVLSGSGHVYAYIDQAAGSCKITRLQVENKAYATTFIQAGSSRSTETIAVPTAENLSQDAWHILLTLTPERVSQESTIWQFACGADAFFRLYHLNGQLAFEVKTENAQYTCSNLTSLQPASIYRIGVSANSSRASICVNGQLVGSLLYQNPLADFDASVDFGSATAALNAFVRDITMQPVALSDEALQAASIPDPALRLVTQPAVEALKYKGFEVDFSNFPAVGIGAGQLLDSKGSVISVPASSLTAAAAAGETWYVFLDYQGAVQLAQTVPDNAVLVLRQCEASGSAWVNIQILPIKETHFVVDDFLASSLRCNGPLVLDTVTYTYTAMGFVDTVVSKTRQGQRIVRYAYDAAGQILAFAQS